MAPRATTELQNAIGRAKDAARLQERAADVYDLTEALLFTSEVVAVVRGCGGEPSELAKRMTEAAAAYRSRPRSLIARLFMSRGTDYDFRKAIAAAKAQRLSVNKADVRPLDGFVAVLGHRSVGPLCEACQVSRVRVLRWHSHGDATLELVVPPGSDLEVLIHNDDFTQMKTVVQILRRVLEFGPSRAFKLMLSIHKKGSASAGVFPHARAVEIARAIIDQAGQRGEPLRASLSVPAAEQP